jgi:uncharacterized integral membrane protein (TIGR00698 family)
VTAPSIFPGLLLAAALALAAKFISLGLHVSAVALAVFLGIVWRNTFGVGVRFETGLQWVTKYVLRTGIALVGLRLTLEGLASVGVVAVPVAIACIATALAVSLALGRALGLSRELSALLALGTSVCGCTAVVAASPVMRAKAVDTGLAVTCVVLLGSTGMLLYPWLANAVLHGDTSAIGVFLGTSIHDTSQVMGAAMIYAQQFGAPEVLPVAAFTKLLRNLSMLLLIPALSYWATSGARSQPAGGHVPTRAQVIPFFLVAFVGFALLRTLGDATLSGAPVAVWQQGVTLLLALSELLLIGGMAAVGLSVSLADLRHVGLRGVTVALIVALAVGACSLLLTTLL